MINVFLFLLGFTSVTTVYEIAKACLNQYIVREYGRLEAYRAYEELG